MIDWLRKNQKQHGFFWKLDTQSCFSFCSHSLIAHYLQYFIRKDEFQSLKPRPWYLDYMMRVQHAKFIHPSTVSTTSKGYNRTRLLFYHVLLARSHQPPAETTNKILKCSFYQTPYIKLLQLYECFCKSVTNLLDYALGDNAGVLPQSKHIYL